MKTSLIAGALAATLCVVAVSPAQAWTRSGSVTTRRGTYTGTASGGCGGGSCWRTRSVTGPNGHTVTQSGNVTRTGPYGYSYSRTTTGPNGGSVTRSGWGHTTPYWARY
jgi:hypothetical protein